MVTKDETTSPLKQATLESFVKKTKHGRSHAKKGGDVKEVKKEVVEEAESGMLKLLVVLLYYNQPIILTILRPFLLQSYHP